MILKARSRKPQAWYLNTTAPASFITIFNQLRENGVQEPFYTYYVPALKEVRDSLGVKLEGTFYLDYPAITDTSEDFSRFLNEFEKATGGAPKAPFNFRTNYNAIKVVFDAIMAVGPDPERARDYLYSYDQPSATGRLRFDRNGDAVDLNLALVEFQAEIR